MRYPLMFSVIREIHFSYGHRLLNYRGKCANLHGHNARLLIELSAEKLDALGMVVDFYEIRRRIGEWIDQNLDHRMILCEKDPYAELLKKAGDPVVTIAENPTAEVLAKWIFTQTRALGFPVSKVTLKETESCSASYSE